MYSYTTHTHTIPLTHSVRFAAYVHRRQICISITGPTTASNSHPPSPLPSATSLSSSSNSVHNFSTIAHHPPPSLSPFGSQCVMQTLLDSQYKWLFVCECLFVCVPLMLWLCNRLLLSIIGLGGGNGGDLIFFPSSSSSFTGNGKGPKTSMFMLIYDRLTHLSHVNAAYYGHRDFPCCFVRLSLWLHSFAFSSDCLSSFKGIFVKDIFFPFAPFRFNPSLKL